MNQTAITENLLTAIETVAQSVVDGVAYDKTVVCTIVDDSQKDVGKYVVSDGSGKFPAYSETTTYKNKDKVMVLVPNGDFTEQKVIVGKQIDDTTPFAYIQPFDTMVKCTNNLIPEKVNNNDGNGYWLTANTKIENNEEGYSLVENLPNDIKIDVSYICNDFLNKIDWMTSFATNVQISLDNDKNIFINENISQDNFLFFSNEELDIDINNEIFIVGEISYDLLNNTVKNKKLSIYSKNPNKEDSLFISDLKDTYKIIFNCGSLILEQYLKGYKFTENQKPTSGIGMKHPIYETYELGKYHKAFNRLGIKANFQSLLEAENVNSGDYGLRLDIYHKNKSLEDKEDQAKVLSQDTGFDSKKEYYILDDKDENFNFQNISNSNEKDEYWYNINLKKDDDWKCKIYVPGKYYYKNYVLDTFEFPDENSQYFQLDEEPTSEKYQSINVFSLNDERVFYNEEGKILETRNEREQYAYFQEKVYYNYIDKNNKGVGGYFYKPKTYYRLISEDGEIATSEIDNIKANEKYFILDKSNGFDKNQSYYSKGYVPALVTYENYPSLKNDIFYFNGDEKQKVKDKDYDENGYEQGVTYYKEGYAKKQMKESDDYQPNKYYKRISFSIEKWQDNITFYYEDDNNEDVQIKNEQEFNDLKNNGINFYYYSLVSDNGFKSNREYYELVLNEYFATDDEDLKRNIYYYEELDEKILTKDKIRKQDKKYYQKTNKGYEEFTGVFSEDGEYYEDAKKLTSASGQPAQVGITYYAASFKRKDITKESYAPGVYYLKVNKKEAEFYGEGNSDYYQLITDNGFDSTLIYFEKIYISLNKTITSTNYKPNTYYKKENDIYVLATNNGFDSNKTYFYEKQDYILQKNLKYEDYIPNKYYIKEEIPEEKYLTSFYLNIEDMLGDPYNFSGAFAQEKVFDISSIGDIICAKLYFYQDNNFKDKFLNQLIISENENLYVSDIEMYFGFDISEVDKEFLQIYSFDSLDYRATPNNYENLKTINLKWVHMDGDKPYVLDKDNIQTFIQDEIDEKIDSLLNEDKTKIDIQKVLENGKISIKQDSSYSPVENRIYFERKEEASPKLEGNCNIQYYLNGSTDFQKNYKYFQRIIKPKEDSSTLRLYSPVNTEIDTSTNEYKNYLNSSDYTFYQKLPNNILKQIDLTEEFVKENNNITIQVVGFKQDDNGTYQEFFEQVYPTEETLPELLYNYYIQSEEYVEDSGSVNVTYTKVEDLSDYEPNKYYYLDLPLENTEIKWFRYVQGEPTHDDHAGVYWKPIEKIDKNIDILSSGLRAILLDDFTIQLDPDYVLNKTERIKVVVEYDGNTYYSNELEFTNQDEVANVPTAQQDAALRMQFLDESMGNYYLYAENNYLIDSSEATKNREVTLLFDLDDYSSLSLLNDAEQVHWIFPIGDSTMIRVNTALTNGTYYEENGFGHIINNNKENQYKLYYQIDNYYRYAKANNTLICNIVKDGVLYGVTQELSFGRLGNSGTEYTLVLDLLTPDNVLTANQENYEDLYYKAFQEASEIKKDNTVQYYEKIIKEDENDESITYKEYKPIAIEDWNGKDTLYVYDKYLPLSNISEITSNYPEKYFRRKTAKSDEISNDSKKGDKRKLITDHYTIKEYYFDYGDNEVPKEDEEQQFKSDSWKKCIIIYYLNEYVETNLQNAYYENLVQATLYDQNHQQIDISMYDISWELLNKTNLNPMFTLERKNNNSCILNPHKIVNGQIDKEFIIVKATLSGFGDYDLTSYLPVAIRRNYIPTRFQGPTQVIYSSTGLPNYYKDEINLYYNDEKGNEKIFPYYTYTEGTKRTENYQIVINKDNAIDKEYSFYPTINYGQDRNTGQTKLSFVPISTYVDGVDLFAIQIWFDGYVIWQQPILYLQNRYFSSTINKWDGNLSIDEDNNTILAKMVGAGSKNRQNQFSGVIMGDWTNNMDAEDIFSVKGDGYTFTPKISTMATQTGLYGFHEGETSFGFMEDGTGFIGKSGSGRIYFNGDSSVITSGRWYNDRTGMYLDIDDGFLLMQSKYEFTGDKDKEYDGKYRYIKFNAKATPASYTYNDDVVTNSFNSNFKSPKEIPVPGKGRDFDYPFVIRGDANNYTQIGWRGDLILHGTHKLSGSDGGLGAVYKETADKKPQEEKAYYYINDNNEYSSFKGEEFDSKITYYEKFSAQDIPGGISLNASAAKFPLNISDHYGVGWDGSLLISTDSISNKYGVHHNVGYEEKSHQNSVVAEGVDSTVMDSRIVKFEDIYGKGDNQSDNNYTKKGYNLIYRGLSNDDISKGRESQSALILQSFDNIYSTENLLYSIPTIRDNNYDYSELATSFKGFYATPFGDLYLSKKLIIGSKFGVNKDGYLRAEEALFQQCNADAFVLKFLQESADSNKPPSTEYLRKRYGDYRYTPTVGVMGVIKGAMTTWNENTQTSTIKNTYNAGIVTGNDFGIKLSSSTNISLNARINQPSSFSNKDESSKLGPGSFAQGPTYPLDKVGGIFIQGRTFLAETKQEINLLAEDDNNYDENFPGYKEKKDIFEETKDKEKQDDKTYYVKNNDDDDEFEKFIGDEFDSSETYYEKVGSEAGSTGKAYINMFASQPINVDSNDGIIIQRTSQKTLIDHSTAGSVNHTGYSNPSYISKEDGSSSTKEGTNTEEGTDNEEGTNDTTTPQKIVMADYSSDVGNAELLEIDSTEEENKIQSFDVISKERGMKKSPFFVYALSSKGKIYSIELTYSWLLNNFHNNVYDIDNNRSKYVEKSKKGSFKITVNKNPEIKVEAVCQYKPISEAFMSLDYDFNGTTESVLFGDSDPDPKTGQRGWVGYRSFSREDNDEIEDNDETSTPNENKDDDTSSENSQNEKYYVVEVQKEENKEGNFTFYNLTDENKLQKYQYSLTSLKERLPALADKTTIITFQVEQINININVSYIPPLHFIETSNSTKQDGKTYYVKNKNDEFEVFTGNMFGPKGIYYEKINQLETAYIYYFLKNKGESIKMEVSILEKEDNSGYKVEYSSLKDFDTISTGQDFKVGENNQIVDRLEGYYPTNGLTGNQGINAERIYLRENYLYSGVGHFDEKNGITQKIVLDNTGFNETTNDSVTHTDTLIPYINDGNSCQARDRHQQHIGLSYALNGQSPAWSPLILLHQAGHEPKQKEDGTYETPVEYEIGMRSKSIVQSARNRFQVNVLDFDDKATLTDKSFKAKFNLVNVSGSGGRAELITSNEIYLSTNSNFISLNNLANIAENSTGGIEIGSLSNSIKITTGININVPVQSAPRSFLKSTNQILLANTTSYISLDAGNGIVNHSTGNISNTANNISNNATAEISNTAATFKITTGGSTFTMSDNKLDVGSIDPGNQTGIYARFA